MNAGGKVAMMTMVTATVALQTMIKFDFKIKVITFIRYTADFPMQLE